MSSQSAYAYRVLRSHPDADRTMMSCGLISTGAGTTRELATREAAQTRSAHPYYHGLLRVLIWRARAGEHYRMPVPDDAQEFTFPYEPAEAAS